VLATHSALGRSPKKGHTPPWSLASASNQSMKPGPHAAPRGSLTVMPAPFALAWSAIRGSRRDRRCPLLFQGCGWTSDSSGSALLLLLGGRFAHLIASVTSRAPRGVRVRARTTKAVARQHLCPLARTFWYLPIGCTRCSHRVLRGAKQNSWPAMAWERQPLRDSLRSRVAAHSPVGNGPLWSCSTHRERDRRLDPHSTP
jgi:hypothetical protein